MPTEAFAISSPNQPISMHFVEHKRAVRCKSVRREFFGEVPREEVQPPILLAVEEAPVVQQERIEKQAAIPSCKNKSKKNEVPGRESFAQTQGRERAPAVGLMPGSSEAAAELQTGARRKSIAWVLFLHLNNACHRRSCGPPPPHTLHSQQPRPTRCCQWHRGTETVMKWVLEGIRSWCGSSRANCHATGKHFIHQTSRTRPSV